MAAVEADEEEEDEMQRGLGDFGFGGMSDMTAKEDNNEVMIMSIIIYLIIL